MKKELLLVAGLTLSGCSAPAEYEAYYTPYGIVYQNNSENDPMVVIHEETHKRRAEEMGILLFFYKYNTDPEFACEEEAVANLEAGYTDIFNHPACEGLDKSEQ